MKHRKMQRHYLAALIPLFVALSGPASAQSITAITAIPQAGNNIFKHLGHGLQVATICHDGGSVMIAFQNLGSDDATLNWWYGMHPYKAQPTGTSPGLVNASGVGVNAYGVVVRGGGLYEMDFWFIDVQIEGQFIFARQAAISPSARFLERPEPRRAPPLQGPPPAAAPLFAHGVR
jgi:hypothetical protein